MSDVVLHTRINVSFQKELNSGFYNWDKSESSKISILVRWESITISRLTFHRVILSEFHLSSKIRVEVVKHCIHSAGAIMQSNISVQYNEFRNHLIYVKWLKKKVNWNKIDQYVSHLS